VCITDACLPDVIELSVFCSRPKMLETLIALMILAAEQHVIAQMASVP
jgi:hypothetical protein